MKKFLIVLASIFVLGFAGLFIWKQLAYGGTSYYTQISQNGRKMAVHADTGETFYRYEYDQPAYDEKGNKKILKFTADHNLRLKAYLKLTDNSSKGVKDWEEVQKSEIPAPAAQKLSN